MGASPLSVGRSLTSLAGGNMLQVLAAVDAHCMKFFAALSIRARFHNVYSLYHSYLWLYMTSDISAGV